jgi:hypothetical protein
VTEVLMLIAKTEKFLQKIPKLEQCKQNPFQKNVRELTNDATVIVKDSSAI